MPDLTALNDLIGSGFTDDAASTHAPNGRYYADPAVHRLEVEQVFHHEWNYFCHQSQIPERGDYMVGEVGEEAIYVIRGKDDVIRAFYNVCQHRGHELLTGSGNIRSVVGLPVPCLELRYARQSAGGSEDERGQGI